MNKEYPANDYLSTIGMCTEIHVETKGELENELADYDYANIESLKITGVLNDVDFLFIYRMMPNLKTSILQR